MWHHVCVGFGAVTWWDFWLAQGLAHRQAATTQAALNPPPTHNNIGMNSGKDKKKKKKDSGY